MAKILVIDDDPIVVLYLKRVLASLGHEVAVATNGAEGMSHVADTSVNLIISDLNMPGEPKNIELIRLMRAARPDCPLVAAILIMAAGTEKSGCREGVEGAGRAVAGGGAERP